MPPHLSLKALSVFSAAALCLLNPCHAVWVTILDENCHSVPAWQTDDTTQTLAAMNELDLDADNDGLTNTEEQALGSDPFNPDTDGDDLPDKWEADNSLHLTDSTDAFADADGDRIPNLWEYSHGTDPLNYYDAPKPDFRVIRSGYNNITTFGSMNSVLTHIKAGGPNVPQKPIVWVSVNTQSQTRFDTTGCNRPVLWLAELSPANGQFDVNIIYGININSYLIIASDTVLDGFVMDGAGYFDFSGLIGPIPQRPPLSAPALIIKSQSATSPLTRVKLVNMIIRRWALVGSQNTAATPGAILNLGGDLTLLNCTLSDSSGWYSGAPGYTLENRGGIVRLLNTIVWCRQGPVNAVLSSPGAVMSLTSVIQGNIGATDPQLSIGGYLTSNSVSCVSTGTTDADGTTLLFSVNGWLRSHDDARTDIGADHWLNSTSSDLVPDTLPDWWEYYWFGDYVQTDSDNQDGDPRVNITEFYDNRYPVGDPFAIEDSNAWAYLTQIYNAPGPPISDVYHNYSLGDTDYDGIIDSVEAIIFGGVHRSGGQDADEDGVPDWLEISPVLQSPKLPMVSQPLLWDSTGDHRRDVFPATAHGPGIVLNHPTRGNGSYAIP